MFSISITEVCADTHTRVSDIQLYNTQTHMLALQNTTLHIHYIYTTQHTNIQCDINNENNTTLYYITVYRINRTVPSCVVSIYVFVLCHHILPYKHYTPHIFAKSRQNMRWKKITKIIYEFYGT